MGIKWLCLLFGITPSTCSNFIDSMISCVCKNLTSHPLAEERFPNDEKMKLFAAQIQLREPSIDDVIGLMDGLSLAMECTSERMAQNAMYCGYDCDMMVNNIFVYGPDGKIFFCAINFSGSWANWAVTCIFLPPIQCMIGSYTIVVD